MAKRIETNEIITTLQYYVDIAVLTYDEYNEYTSWLYRNILSIDRCTPMYYIDMYDDESYTYRFRFRYEEDAMAFKLII